MLYRRMRNPPRKALLSIGLTALGVGLIVLADAVHGDASDVGSAVLAIVGATLAVVSFVVFIWAGLSTLGYNRLIAGRDVVARWHVSAADWDKFRAFDQIRATQHLSLRNDMRLRKQTPLQGVDVIVGRNRIIVDGSYHSITARPVGGRQVNWVGPPADPECLEFPKVYARSHGGSIDLTLRVPVPAAARAEGVKVFEFYRPKPKK